MELKDGAHVHLMGICGTAMASLAGLLKQKGFKVTGSDANVYPPMSTQLAELGIPVMDGYKAENLDPKPDFVVVGNVITRVNPEAQALLAADIPYTSLPKMMGEFAIGDRHSFVISGTHGKTTTTALMAWVTDQLGLKPGYMVGGIPVNFSHSFEYGDGDVFVLEGDEYDTAFFDKVPKFIHYKPKSVALTSLEFDHADIYKNMDEVRAAFQRLMDLIPEDGLLVYWGESDEVAQMAARYRGNKVSYGLKSGDLTLSDVSFSEEGMKFSCTFQGQSLGSFESLMFGEHNLLNHLAVLSFAVHHGWDMERVRKALKSFKGVKRRQEILGKPGGVWMIEDFAHHPTAVRMTIHSMRLRFPKAKIFALFEPRSATSRRSIFQKDYVQAFAESDVVMIAPPFNQEKIDPSERFSSDKLVQDLRAKGVSASVLTPEEMTGAIKSQATPGDVVVIMSNGAFGGIYQKLLQ